MAHDAFPARATDQGAPTPGLGEAGGALRESLLSRMPDPFTPADLAWCTEHWAELSERERLQAHRLADEIRRSLAVATVLRAGRP